MPRNAGWLERASASARSKLAIASSWRLSACSETPRLLHAAAWLGITASVRQRLELDVSFTHYGGAGQYNLLGDRDFLAASVKFSF